MAQRRNNHIKPVAVGEEKEGEILQRSSPSARQQKKHPHHGGAAGARSPAQPPSGAEGEGEGKGEHEGAGASRTRLQMKGQVPML